MDPETATTRASLAALALVRALDTSDTDEVHRILETHTDDPAVLTLAAAQLARHSLTVGARRAGQPLDAVLTHIEMGHLVNEQAAP